MMKLVYAAVFLAIGGLAIWAGMHVSGAIGEGAGWPTTDGTVGEKRLEAAPQLRSRSWEPRAKYTYTVDGKSYTSDQVYQLKGTGGTNRSMQALLDGLPATVKVHYDPKDPSRAYLVANPRSTSWLYVGVGVLAILIGLGLLLAWWGKRGAAS